jgi:two-component system chemotaxis sensor kinase CheA
MDVVKRNIEALRGTVEIATVMGQGSTFTVRVPLTLAITDGMLVQVGFERYILPTASIQMSLRLSSTTLSKVLGRGEMIKLRNELLPVVRLRSLFHVPELQSEREDGLLVVIDVGNRRCALLVDELLGQQQVVVKSLGEGVGRITGVAGGAIMGDGRVGLMLDPAGLVALARQS